MDAAKYIEVLDGLVTQIREDQKAELTRKMNPEDIAKEIYKLGNIKDRIIEIGRDFKETYEVKQRFINI